MKHFEYFVHCGISHVHLWFVKCHIKILFISTKIFGSPPLNVAPFPHPDPGPRRKSPNEQRLSLEAASPGVSTVPGCPLAPHLRPVAPSPVLWPWEAGPEPYTQEEGPHGTVIPSAPK